MEEIQIKSSLLLENNLLEPFIYNAVTLRGNLSRLSHFISLTRSSGSTTK